MFVILWKTWDIYDISKCSLVIWQWMAAYESVYLINEGKGEKNETIVKHHRPLDGTGSNVAQ